MANSNAQLISSINFTQDPPDNSQGHGRSGIDLDHDNASSARHRNPDSGADTDTDPDPDPNPETSLTRRRTSAEGPGIGSHLEEHAVVAARRRKLPAASEDDVLHVARLSAEERSIEIYSTLASIKCRLDQLAERGAEEPEDHKLPQQLKATLILASTAEDLRYRNGQNKPAAMIKNQYRRKRDFNSAYFRTGPKGENFARFVDKACTDARAKIKEKILNSIETGQDVLSLTVNIQDGLADWSHNDVKATKLLAVRIALLRAVLRSHQDSSDYWGAVDKQLDEITQRCSQPGACTFTEALTQIYDHDIAAYPPVNPALLDRVVRTGSQQMMDKHITPSFPT